MSSSLHDHCGCGAHHGPVKSGDRRVGLWSGVPALLACAVCPACVATYAKVLSLVGVSFEMSELQHTVLLGIALGISLLVSGWRSVRTQRVWPIAFAVLGSALVLLGHLAGDLHVMEWSGVLVLLVAGVFEQVRLRRLALA